MRVELDLPELTDDERAHSARLAHLLVEKIKAKGSIPFSEYFAECLYHPELGYYTGALPKFGSTGDFVTAPMISQYFSYCLANQIAEILALCESPSIMEVGAGTGVMATDILTQLKTINALPEYYYIIEISSILRERQRDSIAKVHPELIDRVIWLNEPLKEAWQGCIIGNEIVDALPVERFTIQNGEAYYADVGYDAVTERFITIANRQDDQLTEFMAQLAETNITLPDGYVSEFCPMVKSWLADLTKTLTKGAVLMVDYGYSRQQYYMQERVEGTLIAHFKHRVHNSWELFQGLQDLTANVDFTLLAEAGLDADLDFLGYTSQAYFLYGNGLEAMLTEAKAQISDEMAWYKIAQAIQILVLPAEMGERFKVLALGKNIELEPQGFALYDMSQQL